MFCWWCWERQTRMEDLKSSSWPWKENLWHKIKQKKSSNDFYHFQKGRKEGWQRKRKEWLYQLWANQETAFWVFWFLERRKHRVTTRRCWGNSEISISRKLLPSLEWRVTKKRWYCQNPEARSPCGSWNYNGPVHWGLEKNLWIQGRTGEIPWLFPFSHHPVPIDQTQTEASRHRILGNSASCDAEQEWAKSWSVGSHVGAGTLAN